MDLKKKQYSKDVKYFPKAIQGYWHTTYSFVITMSVAKLYSKLVLIHFKVLVLNSRLHCLLKNALEKLDARC